MKKIFLAVSFFSTFLINAQHTVTTTPSPSALGGFNTSQSLVDMATGAVNYSIPITTISESHLSIPISLDYYSNGIRVEEIASWVGMGWRLNAGAVITRSVIGYPDDLNDEDKGIGILHSNALNEIEGLNFNDPEESLSDFITDYYEDKKDTQPDIYTINLFGKQLNFLFNKNDEIVLVGNHNFNIEYTLSTDGKIIRFDLTDENGVSYVFDQYETTTETTTYRTFNVNSGHIQADEDEKTIIFNSAWHLSSMFHLNNTITFEYNTDNIEYNKKKLEISQICKNQDCETYPTALGTSIPIRNSSIKVSSKKIKKILTSNDKIEFYRNSRLDVKGGTKLYLVRITSLITNKKIDYNLNHIYMNSPNQTSENPYIFKRLQLKTIFKNNKKTQEFFYDTNVLPNRESSEQDFWGYYNGNGATTLIPKVYIYPESLIQKTSFYQQIGQGQEFMVNGADRSSNINYAKAGTLKRIKDYLGNTINLDYELNNFKYNNYEFQGNGLRLRNIEVKEFDGYSYNKQYSYVLNNGLTSGIVDILPSFSYYHELRNIRYIYNEQVYDETPNRKYKLQLASYNGFPGPYITDLGPSNWTNSQKQYYSTLRFSLSLSNNISSDYLVYYTQTTESFLDKKIVYSFEINDLQFEFPSNTELSETLIRKVRSKEDINLGFGEDPEIIQATIPNYFDITYPFIPKLSKSWNIIDLKEVSYFNDSELVKKDVYDYQIISRMPNYNSVAGLKFDFFERANYLYLSANQALSDVYRKSVIFISKYLYLINTSKLPLTKTTFFYENGASINDGEIQYIYNSLGLINEEKKIIGDKEYKTIFKYPYDVSSLPYMSNLISQNRLSEVIEQEQYLNNEFIGKTTTEYGSFTNNNFILPYKTRNYNKNNELTNTSVASKYDDKGNTIETYDEEMQVYSSTLTAYNNQLVIAQSSNAKHNEIFHTSFEEDGVGGFPSGEHSYSGEKFNIGSFIVPFVKPNQKLYVVSYWKMDQSNKWSFSGYIPYTDNMEIGNSDYVIDEVRVHPADAKMKTMTYDKLHKTLLTSTDERGNVTRYKYDSFGKVILVLDKDRKVLKKYNYNYKN